MICNFIDVKYQQYLTRPLKLLQLLSDVTTLYSTVEFRDSLLAQIFISKNISVYPLFI
ncbi:hypothetical protein [Pantoea sp. Aalb]|uniref:hypothetical protein n=1 Tax=Pantoea sp. Aalb TaxID=2576762 RepID=UPI001F39A49E|nr:hypothetical protein [Pantoea sp. Aalb]